MLRLKQLIPVRIKDAIKVLIGTASVRPVGGLQPNQADRPSFPTAVRFCPVCRQTTEFAPLPFEHILDHLRYQCAYHLWESETLNFMEYYCRVCRAIDRERLFALYLERAWDREQTVLEIAPQPSLTAFLRSLPGAVVRTADLCDPNADDLVDIMDMGIYSSEQFDVWICSHVLEHVSDDRLAMRELYRILKPGGWGIVMVPINRAVATTHEDPSITDTALRWKYFGQNDHVRMYAKADFLSRLEFAGFQISQVKAESFGVEQCARVGITLDSILYVVRKPAAPASSI